MLEGALLRAVELGAREVLVSLQEHCQRLVACRLQADICNSPLLVVRCSRAVPKDNCCLKLFANSEFTFLFIVIAWNS